ncbi:MAG: hypothetical protein WCX81_00180 [Monoglobales bacterium]
MNKLKVGYSKVNANPPLGIGISGYYIPRYAKGFLDDIEVGALALSCDDRKILMISIDNCGIDKEIGGPFREAVQVATGVPADNIFMSATHTHTGPSLKTTDRFDEKDNVVLEYRKFLGTRVLDACIMALADLKPAKMGFITGYAPERVAYIRRYKMKDGSTFTCPPINDPNIDHPIGTLDQRVHILRFDRENDCSIVLVNYGVHADTVNGEMISSDWPGWMRKTIEKALDGTKCVFFAGAQGDVGSTNVHPSGGDMNDTEISFDNEMKSPGMARFVGRALAGTVLQVYDKVEYVDVEEIDIKRKGIVVEANVPTKEQMPLAKKYKELHDSGRDDLIPYKAMQLTTVVAEALRMCRMENGPESYNVELTGVKIGPVALVGIPGEPFTDIGVSIKEAEGYKMIMPCALTNGNMGYFPMKSAYDEGGYEARTSPFKSGVAEKIIEGGKALLAEMKK